MSEKAEEHNPVNVDNSDPNAISDRSARNSLLAQSPAEDLSARWSELGLAPKFTYLRRPEIGLVMTQGRAGAVGERFNLGEATVTRCSVRLATGEEGHAYALGRSARKAEISALCDALMQTKHAAALATKVLAPLAYAQSARREDAARKAAATKVEFFTMTRGEG
ncbi:MAG: phosphonate C-P lyase system protein PhnG [Neomegalonema sp.]